MCIGCVQGRQGLHWASRTATLLPDLGRASLRVLLHTGDASYPNCHFKFGSPNVPSSIPSPQLLQNIEDVESLLAYWQQWRQQLRELFQEAQVGWLCWCPAAAGAVGWACTPNSWRSTATRSMRQVAVVRHRCAE